MTKYKDGGIVPKEQKYYTMKECFDECGDDDKPFINNGFNCDMSDTKSEIINYSKLDISYSEIYSDKWQIKRAEPKVLSAEEWINKRIKILSQPNVIGNFHWHTKDIYDCAEYFLKNGQNREWLRPEQVELREALKKCFYYPRGRTKHEDKRVHDSCRVFNSDYIKEVFDALDNLKPPREV